MMTTGSKQESMSAPVYSGANHKSGRFTMHDLALLGVLSALSTILNFVVSMIMHATGLIAIPGLSSFVTGFAASVVAYAMLRKVCKFGALTVLAVINALIAVGATGHVFTAAGLVVGGLTGDLYLKVVRGHEGRRSPIVALMLFRGIKEVSGMVVPVLVGVTQLRFAWYLLIISVIAGIIGAFVGGLSGRSLMDRLSKSGAIR